MVKDFFRKSIPAKSSIHGIEIKKLPIGKYLDAVSSIKDLPEILLKNNFPGMNSEEILKKFKKIDENMLFELVGSLMVVVPDQALRFVANLIDVPFDVVRNELTPNELKDVLKEFWKVNDMTDFFADILGAVKSWNLAKILSKTTNTGSRI
jgi:hypothetical protein